MMVRVAGIPLEGKVEQHRLTGFDVRRALRMVVFEVTLEQHAFIALEAQVKRPHAVHVRVDCFAQSGRHGYVTADVLDGLAEIAGHRLASHRQQEAVGGECLVADPEGTLVHVRHMQVVEYAEQFGRLAARRLRLGVGTGRRRGFRAGQVAPLRIVFAHANLQRRNQAHDGGRFEQDAIGKIDPRRVAGNRLACIERDATIDDGGPEGAGLDAGQRRLLARILHRHAQVGKGGEPARPGRADHGVFGNGTRTSACQPNFFTYAVLRPRQVFEPQYSWCTHW